MNKEEARAFVENYAAGAFTPDQHTAFEQWVYEQPLQEVQLLLDEYTLLLEKHPAWLPANRELLERMLKEIDRQQPKVIPLYSWKKKLAVAAGILVLVLGGSYAGWQYKNGHAHTRQIRAAGAKATLQLGDGRVVELDSTGNAALAQQARILKIAAGVLTYNQQEKEGAATYNVLTTPRGGQYEVRLQDGTRVWLNAASSIRFPVIFTGNDRTVEITGEAYFEVAKNTAKPFFVKAGNMQVQVLGTHFNIMAYPEENNIRTTLAEGAVTVSNGTVTKHLTPGQQSVLTGTDFDVRTVDLEQEMAWKEGRFIFNDNIRGIMRQLVRWYDITVDYEGNISDQAFIGDISRKENLGEVLKILELTGKIHFRTINRKIIVMP